MDSDMKSKISEIKAIEDRYGLTLFWMSFIHLFETGRNNMSDESIVRTTLNEINKNGEEDRKNGVIRIMTADFECHIIHCAAELARFSPMTLFAYIKKHLVIN